MKILICLLLLAGTIQVCSQQFKNYNFANDGFNVTASFPGRPSKDFSTSNSYKMLTLTEKKDGTTYALILTNTASGSIAAQSVTNTVQKLWNAAKQKDVQQQSSIAGTASTYLKYISNNDVFITSHTFSFGEIMCQAMVLQKGSYTNETNANIFFSSILIGNTPANNNFNNNTNNNIPVYKRFEKVEVLNRNDNKWYSGKITSIDLNGNYKINYDESRKPTEENVTIDRIRRGNNLTANNDANNNTTNLNSIGKPEKNDRVEVWDAKTNKWYGAIILKENLNKTYRISFDGYAENYDEDVAPERIRNMTTTTAPLPIPYIKLKRFGKTTINGNLQTGKIVEDLSWATSSQMACWPSIRDIEFQGKHMAYWFDLPEKSVAKITVTPKNTNRRINIYGYAGFDLKTTPPALVYTNICEAAHPTWVGQPNLNEPSKPQTIEFNTTTRRTTIYFAVAGARNVLDGDYTILIEVN